MDISQIEKLKAKVESSPAIEGVLKFVVDDKVFIIDGSGAQNTFSQEDKDSDCTITTSLESLSALRDGSLNPMMAVMNGKIKIKGDMSLAMKVQSLFG